MNKIVSFGLAAALAGATLVSAAQAAPHARRPVAQGIGSDARYSDDGALVTGRSAFAPAQANGDIQNRTRDLLGSDIDNGH